MSNDTENELEALDYYTLLDLALDATTDEIRAAFRRFALRYHPDRFAGEPADVAARALAIYRRGTEAIGVLSDPAQRRAYDTVLARGEKRLKDDPTSLLQRAAPPPAPPPKVATFGKPSEASPRASRPKRPTKKSMRAMRAVPKSAPPPAPAAPAIKSPQARAFYDRAQAAVAAGDLRGAWRMLKAAVDAEPGNGALESALYAVERQFRA